MATILLRVPLDAEPSAVYEALATSDGVKGWWSNHTDGPDGVGSSMKVGFPDAPMTFDFEVVEEVAGERVAWRCLAGPPEWVGTSITYDIQTNEGETSVLSRTTDGLQPRSPFRSSPIHGLRYCPGSSSSPRLARAIHSSISE